MFQRILITPPPITWASPLARKAPIPFRALIGLMILMALASSAWAAGFSSDRIHVQVVGEGRDIILVPGLGSSPEVWSNLVQSAPGNRFHLVHVHGFAGLPAAGNREAPIAGPVAEELLSYANAAGLERPVIVGHSMGGTIALMMAGRAPAAVAGVVVLDMPPFLGSVFGRPGMSDEDLQSLADDVRSQLLGLAPSERRQRLVEEVAGMVTDAEGRETVLQDRLASDEQVVANALHELILTDLSSELSSIRAPVKVMYVQPAGANLSEAQIDAFYRDAYGAVATVQLTRIPDSAHFIMLDQPAAFRTVLLDFLDEIEGGRGQ